MIDVTVTENGQELAKLQFDDSDLRHRVKGIEIVLEHAVAASKGAAIWKRVAHAATVAAWSEDGFGGQ